MSVSNLRNNVLHILNEVDTLLADESKWTQGQLAINGGGYACEPDSRFAKAWCLGGAVQHIVLKDAKRFCDAQQWYMIGVVNSILNKALNRFITSSRYEVYSLWNDTTDFKTMKLFLRDTIQYNVMHDDDLLYAQRGNKAA